MWLIWIPLIILAVWLIMRMANNNKPSGYEGESPMKILRRRYARGEISSEEYERRKKSLNKGND